MKTTDATAFDGLMLKQKAGAADTLKAEKRNPATDTSLKAVEVNVGATTKDRVKTTLDVAAK